MLQAIVKRFQSPISPLRELIALIHEEWRMNLPSCDCDKAMIVSGARLDAQPTRPDCMTEPTKLHGRHKGHIEELKRQIAQLP
jgi:hypothetical protein